MFPEKEPNPHIAIAKRTSGKKGDNTIRNVRVGLGKRWSAIVTDVRDGHYTWEEFVETLDHEELARGQLRNDNGSFSGRPPALVPRAFFEVCQREMMRRFNDEMKANLMTATEQYLKLATTENTMEPKDRAKLLQWIIERVAGPAPKEAPRSDSDTFDVLVRGVIVETGEGVGKTPPDRYSRRNQDLTPDEDKDWS